MNRTTMLFEQAKKFYYAVLDGQKELDEREKEIEDLKGSPRYNRLKAQLDEERKELVKNARDRFAPESDNIMQNMLRAAQKAKPMTPPTTEMINTLQLLDMRYRQYEDAKKDGNHVGNVQPLTSSELNAAAALMEGNPTALKSLQNIAHRCGIMLIGLKPKGLADGEAEEMVKTGARSLSTLYHLPKLDNRKAWAEMAHGHINDETGGHAWDYYRMDAEPKNEDDFIKGVFFVDDAHLAEFKETLNQEL